MTAILDVINNADVAFADPQLKIPEPPHEMKRKLEVLQDKGLEKHRAALIFDIRLWQAEKMGFKQTSLEEMVEMLMGETHTNTAKGAERHSTGWIYDHHLDDVLNGNWGSNPNQFYRMERKSFWYMPPFAKKEKWRCQFGGINYLKREMPYGVLLRLKEAKELKLFNAFRIIAPMEAWISPEKIDPILVGEIWELPPDEKGEYSNSGRERYFPLAQWK